MSNQTRENEEESRRLVIAINDFLREQLNSLTNLSAEDRDCLEIAIQCLEMAFGLENGGYFQNRYPRPLLDIFTQVTNPVSVKDKIRADAYKDEGNNYMRRSMYSEAEAEYTKAIELDKWNAIYYCNRASSRIEQQHFFDAISDCRQALMLNPDYAKAQARMGQAYALLHRPREAARCFRQALELEPGNERYRNNLRVAEGQIENRQDPLSLITTLLNSVFGLRPSTSSDNSSNINLPTSFMIITESHPPRRNTPAESSQSCESNTNRNTLNNHDRTQNIVYPLPFGVINERSEEESIPQVDTSTENRENDAQDASREFIIEIPSLAFFESQPPPVCPSDSCVDSTENAAKANENQTAKNKDESDKNVVKKIKTSHTSQEEVETETTEAQQMIQNNQSNESKVEQNGKNLSKKSVSSRDEPMLRKDVILKESIKNLTDPNTGITSQTYKNKLSYQSDNIDTKENDQIADESKVVSQVVDKIAETLMEEEAKNSGNINTQGSSPMEDTEQNKTKNNNESIKNISKENVNGLNANGEKSKENKFHIDKENIKSSKEKQGDLD